MKKVTNVYGEVITVDDTQCITGYNNKEKKIWCNAEIIKDGEHSGFYTDFIKEGVIDDFEQRIKASHLNSSYASMVGYYASKNDPDKKIWNKFVDFVKEHNDEIFDEYGDIKNVNIVANKDGEFIIK